MGKKELVTTLNESVFDDVLVDCKQGVISKSDLENKCKEYIDQLPVPESIYNNSTVFQGLIRYLHRTLIKPIIPNTTKHDYKLYDCIFENIYMYLLSIYGYLGNIITFCYLIGVDYKYISDIHMGNYNNGLYKQNDCEINIDTLRIISKWYNSIESSYVDKVGNQNGIGAMFLLKSVYGYSDTQTVRIDMAENKPQIDVRQLAELAEIPLPES